MGVLNSFLPGENFQKKLPSGGGGWSGLELTDTLYKVPLVNQVGDSKQVVLKPT